MSPSPPLENPGNPGIPVGPIDTPRDLGRELKRWTLRGPRGPVKVAALAKRLGMSQSTLYAYLAGTTLPSVEALDELLAALGVPADAHRQLTTARDLLQRPRGGPREGCAPPAELPADPVGFTGRDSELAALDRAFAEGPPLVVVAGPAGVGKTALAVRWGHRARFPDGCLYVDLHGYSQGEPLDPADVLAGLLRGLGVEDVPVDVRERGARFRSALARKRLLLVLDNALHVSQVRPLLPGGPSCFTVVTSRTDLAGLRVQPGALHVDLRPFDPRDGVALLREQIGADVDRSAPAALRLAERCGGLPLALRIVAARARGGPSLEELAAGLGPGLDGFDVGDPDTAVRTVFSWSVRHLDERAVRDFRLLGAHPAHDLAPPAAAALLGTDPADAARRLDVLVRAHLVQHSAGRYGMHDLIREFAREQPVDGLDDALDRLVEHYTAETAAMMEVLHPTADRVPDLPVGVARDWVEAEWNALLALIASAARRGRAAQTARLGGTVQRHLDEGGRYVDALAILGHVHDAARAAGDRSAEAAALYHLGVAHLRLGRHEAAMDHHSRAIAICRGAGDRAGEAGALNNLGNLHERLGRYPEALAHYRRALVLVDDLGLRKGRAVLLLNIGVVHTRLGDLAQAVTAYEEALVTFSGLGDHGGCARTLGNLAEAHHLSGRHDEALRLYDRALALAREVDARGIETEVLNNLAAAHLSAGEVDLALAAHSRALDIAREVGDRYEQARALEGIGTARGDTGCRREALAIYRQLGLGEADRVAALLARDA
ncbi:ATP-binding protein [Saccharothrix longispora]|uniref:ATP-binding protein n=1 Tax=Saccharothrix longispora TaxID=33920 RepID=UPI0028FD14E7|nr:tetratricopeptide repeat protein [Saccharothrix longispora]MBY8848044.1 tetratricopeptide repeat protein [Saccharothrix sp. MB29]MDU0294488.1 tetratricopeptide repeat protein [Saccharothrix longispora]